MNFVGLEKRFEKPKKKGDDTGVFGGLVMITKTLQYFTRYNT